MSISLKTVPFDGRVAPYRPPTAAANPLTEREIAVHFSEETARPVSGLPLAPLGGVLDTIDQGIVLLRSDAYPFFSNSAAERLLRGDAQRGDLATGTRSLSKAVLASRESKPAEVEVSTQGGRYRLRAILLAEKINEVRTRAVLVTVEHAASKLPPRECLMERFGMTRRESDVALRLAVGRNNAAVASELDISAHTARHHTESVLAKLGVHTPGPA